MARARERDVATGEADLPVLQQLPRRSGGTERQIDGRAAAAVRHAALTSRAPRAAGPPALTWRTPRRYVAASAAPAPNPEVAWIRDPSPTGPSSSARSRCASR